MQLGEAGCHHDLANQYIASPWPPLLVLETGPPDNQFSVHIGFDSEHLGISEGMGSPSFSSVLALLPKTTGDQRPKKEQSLIPISLCKAVKSVLESSGSRTPCSIYMGGIISFLNQSTTLSRNWKFPRRVQNELSRTGSTFISSLFFHPGSKHHRGELIAFLGRQVRGGGGMILEVRY